MGTVTDLVIELLYFIVAYVLIYSNSYLFVEHCILPPVLPNGAFPNSLPIVSIQGNHAWGHLADIK